VDGPLTAAKPIGLVAMRCRTSDRSAASVRGVEILAAALGDRFDTEPRSIGSPQPPKAQRYDEDLAGSRGCLLEAGGQVDDALAEGRLPVLLAGDCSVALTTLPAVARHRPDAVVLWLDAHGDFNTPETTESGFLGGMCLAGACGRWAPGLAEPAFEADRLVLAGVRELDADERGMLEASGATLLGPTLETLVGLVNALDGRPVYVHLDLDVVDPEVMPAQFPAAGGLPPEKLYDLLEAVSDECELIGIEVTCFEAPDDEGEAAALAEVVADCVGAALGEGSQPF